MSEALSIRVAGAEINGRPRDLTRPWGLFVQKGGFQGWGSLPAGRREALARAVAHGEHDVPVYLPSRVVTIDGWAIEENPTKLQKLLERVRGLAATGDRNRVTVTEWGLTRWADARRMSCDADGEGRGYGKYVRAAFQLQFVFSDPRKYGDVATLPDSGTATSIPVFHYGNFPAFPRVEIPSAPAAYTITSPGGTFTVAGATAGGTHVVDLRRGRVYRNGVEMPGVGRGDLWAVPVGAAWTHTLSVAGRMRIADTFV